MPATAGPRDGPALSETGWSLVLLLIVLVVVMALVVAGAAYLSSRSASQTRQREEYSGGGAHDGPTSATVCGGGTTENPGLSSHVLISNTRSFVDSANAGEHHPADAIDMPVTGGAIAIRKKQKPKKPWRAYNTWEELMKDKAALDVYWEERNEVLNNLPTDWSKVRKQYASLVKDPFEWAGHIDIVKGKLQIVSKFPSRDHVEMSPLSAVRASVAPEVARQVWSKPALFVYHTHPVDKEAPTMAQPPSPTDLSSAIYSSFKGHFAAELVLSPNAIYMFGLRAARRTALWNSPRRTLEVTRVAFDVYCAFAAMRSYAEFYTLSEIEALAHKFGIFYVTYPDDHFAQPRYNLLVQLRSYVDVIELRTLTDELDRIQREAYESPVTHGHSKSKKRAPLTEETGPV